MRFRWDGMPRELPLSREERRVLAGHVSRIKVPGQPIWIGAVPAAVMLGMMGIWMPAIEYLQAPWKWLVLVAAVAMQLPTTLWLMHRVNWPYRCKAMAMAGYEVCPRCAYPQKDAPPEKRVCSECGAARVENPS